MKIKTFTATGSKATEITVPSSFLDKSSDALIAQSIYVYRDSSHIGLSKVKTRSEVVTSKAKIWRQKGTGRARHGSRNAPIFVGGGKAHGPKGLKRNLTISKKMRQKAFKSLLAKRIKDGKVFAVNKIDSISKTKDAAGLVNSIIDNNKYRVTLALSDKNHEKSKVFRNIVNVNVVNFSDLNVYSLYLGGILIVDSGVFEKKVTKNK
jgi:large subunit ribosomal protein L4